MHVLRSNVKSRPPACAKSTTQPRHQPRHSGWRLAAANSCAKSLPGLPARFHVVSIFSTMAAMLQVRSGASAQLVPNLTLPNPLHTSS
jgi:hypothetical protein